METNPVMLLTNDGDLLRTEQRQSDEKGYLHDLSLNPGTTVSSAQSNVQANEAIAGVEETPPTGSTQSNSWMIDQPGPDCLEPFFSIWLGLFYG